MARVQLLVTRDGEMPFSRTGYGFWIRFLALTLVLIVGSVSAASSQDKGGESNGYASILVKFGCPNQASILI